MVLNLQSKGITLHSFHSSPCFLNQHITFAWPGWYISSLSNLWSMLLQLPKQKLRIQANWIRCKQEFFVMSKLKLSEWTPFHWSPQYPCIHVTTSGKQDKNTNSWWIQLCGHESDVPLIFHYKNNVITINVNSMTQEALPLLLPLLKKKRYW